MNDQARDGRTTGMILAQHLPEEHPEGDQRGEDPVQPVPDGGQPAGEDVIGEDVGGRQPGAPPSRAVCHRGRGDRHEGRLVGASRGRPRLPETG